MSKQHVEATFDMLLRHVAGVDGALRVPIRPRYRISLYTALIPRQETTSGGQ